MRWAALARHCAIFAVLFTTHANAQSSLNAPQATSRDFESGGVRYRETRTIVKQPINDVRYVDQPQVTYQTFAQTEVQNLVQDRLVPVTQYETVPRMYDWWRVFGVFGQPYVACGMEPYTAVQRQTVPFSVPVTRQQVVPYTRTVKVAVPYLRFEDKEQVTTVALGPAAATQVASIPQPSYTPPTGGLVVPPPVVPTNLAPWVPGPQQPTYLPADPYQNRGTFPNGFTPAIPSVNPGYGLQTSLPPIRSSTDGMTFSTRAAVGTPSTGYFPPATAWNNGWGNAPATENSSNYGGVARLTGDPPRYGISTGTSVR